MFLIRNTLYDAGDVPSTDCTIQFSPDIICTQNRILTYYEAKNTYSEHIGLPLRQYIKNRIFIRAVNHTGVAQSGVVRMFAKPASALYCQSGWKPLCTDNGAQTVALYQMGVDPPEPGAFVIGYVSFVFWDTSDPHARYAFIAQTRTSGEQWTDLPKGWADDEELWTYLRMHPEVGLVVLGVV